MNRLMCVLALFGTVLTSVGQGPGVAGGSPAAAAPSQKAQAAARLLVIDVRSPEEYLSEHITGTTNVPLGELQERIAKLAGAKNTPLAVHCRSGGRSARAKKLLEEQGYTNVKNLGSLANARKVLAVKGPGP